MYIFGVHLKKKTVMSIDHFEEQWSGVALAIENGFLFFVLPFTFWSLMTQAFIIQKWCLFCCTIAFLLWANVIVLLVFDSFLVNLSISETELMALLLFISSLFTIYKTNKMLGSKDNFFIQQRETAIIKYNILTIQAHLSKSTQQIANIGFIWGNPDSSHEFGLYVSIICSHCTKAIRELRRLTEIYPDFSYRLIFVVNTDNTEEKANMVIHYLINLYKTMKLFPFYHAPNPDILLMFRLTKAYL